MRHLQASKKLSSVRPSIYLANHQSGCFVAMLFPNILSSVQGKTVWMWGKDFKKIQPMREKIDKKSGLPDMVRLIFFVGLFV